MRLGTELSYEYECIENCQLNLLRTPVEDLPASDDDMNIVMWSTVRHITLLDVHLKMIHLVGRVKTSGGNVSAKKPIASNCSQRS